jgi:glycosyltransferase involved in cell wall biosynthesis
VRFVRLLRRDDVQVLHSHKFGSNAWAAVVARLAGVPVFVAHEHSWAFRGNRLRSAVTRHVVARRAAAIVAVSELDRRRMIELEHVPSRRIVVCPNGVPETQRDVDLGQPRRELDVPEGTSVVGFVGGLRPEKRVDLLLRAVGLLHEQGRPVVAVIVGDGPELQRLNALADRLGIGAAVRFTRRRDDAATVLRLFDVAVLSSEREGSPLALLEYMAAARPIVATQVGGVPELIRDAIDGLLVPPGDPAALAEAIGRLLADRELAAALGASAAARQASAFTLDSAVRRIEALYDELLAR